MSLFNLSDFEAFDFYLANQTNILLATTTLLFSLSTQMNLASLNSSELTLIHTGGMPASYGWGILQGALSILLGANLVWLFPHTVLPLVATLVCVIFR